MSRFVGMGTLKLPPRAEGELCANLGYVGPLVILLYDSSGPVTVTRVVADGRELEIEQTPQPSWRERPPTSVRVKPPRPTGGHVRVHVRNDSDDPTIFTAGWVV